MRFLLLVSVLLTFATGSARADMVWHDAYKSPLSDWGAYQYYRNVKQPMAERGRATPAKARPVAHAPLAATDFRRTGTGRGVVTKYVAALPLAAADADQVTAALTTTLAQLQATGRKNNVATALAVTIVLANTVLERATYDGPKADQLVTSINDALAGSPAFERLGAAGRQQMADELYLSSALLVLLHQAGATSAAQAVARQVLATVTGSAG